MTATTDRVERMRADLRERGYTPTTVEQYAQGAERWMKWLGRRKPSRSLLSEWKAELLADGYSQSTASKMESGGKAFLDVVNDDHGLRGAQGRNDKAVARAERMHEEYLTEGETLQTVGVRHGLTRERVRQLVKMVDPDAAAKKRAQVKAQRARERAAREQQERAAAPTCEVCGEPVLRTGRSTCTRRCTSTYDTLKRLVDPEHHAAHRRSMAKAAVRAGDGAAWAVRALENPSEVTRARYVVEGSKVWHAVKDAVERDLPIASRIPAWAVEDVFGKSA